VKKILLSIYPQLFAVYPILALVVHNIIYIDPGSIVRSLLIAIVGTSVIWVLLKLIFRDWGKAGIVTVLALVLFFSYGHVYLQLQNSLGEALRHRVLAGVYFLIFVLGAWLTFAKLKNPATLQRALVTGGCVLAGFSIIQLAGYKLYSNSQALAAAPVNLGSDASDNGGDVNPQDLPDIYWILLDGHTRSDILQENYSHDNSAFIQELENMGFYVAGCSQSNYPSTRYSVVSLMNANYLDQLPGVTRGIPPLKKSLVNQTIRSLGYTVIAFENRSNGHFDLGEDMRLSRNQLALGIIDFSGGVNEFEVMLMQTSALRLIYDMPQLIPGLDPQILVEGEFYEHYQQTLFILNKLPDLPKTQAPKFVFAHILVPHPPYIFSPDGKFLWAENQVVGYKSNTQFIDARITEVAKEIIENSDRPVIIVIQGDHGPSGSQVTPHMRMSILNAYYLNDEAKQDLYGTITPVNTFRIIFNRYFGTSYPLLEDKSYLAFGEGQFSPENIVPNTCVPDD
jgi:hypothetical protein